MINVEKQNQQKWDNKGGGPLSVECSNNNGEALYRVKSVFSYWRRDGRRWKWDCRKVANKPMSDCSWTPFINKWGGPIDKKCPANFVLTGIKVQATGVTNFFYQSIVVNVSCISLLTTYYNYIECAFKCQRGQKMETKVLSGSRLYHYRLQKDEEAKHICVTVGLRNVQGRSDCRTSQFTTHQ